MVGLWWIWAYKKVDMERALVDMDDMGLGGYDMWYLCLIWAYGNVFDMEKDKMWWI